MNISRSDWWLLCSGSDLWINDMLSATCFYFISLDIKQQHAETMYTSRMPVCVHIFKWIQKLMNFIEGYIHFFWDIFFNFSHFLILWIFKTSTAINKNSHKIICSYISHLVSVFSHAYKVQLSYRFAFYSYSLVCHSVIILEIGKIVSFN